MLLRDGGDGDVRRLRPLDVPFALPLGLGGMLDGPPQGAVTLALAEGDLLVACSDGVTEARDAEDHFCPLAGRLGGAFTGSQAETREPARGAEFIAQDVASWGAEPQGRRGRAHPRTRELGGSLMA